MGHGLGGVLSATPAFCCVCPERALTSLESARWITVYRTPRTALRNLYTASRAGLTGGTGRDVGFNFCLRGGWLPAVDSSARSSSGLTASAASFAKVSTLHERGPPCSGDRAVAALRRSRREAEGQRRRRSVVREDYFGWRDYRSATAGSSSCAEPRQHRARGAAEPLGISRGLHSTCGPRCLVGFEAPGGIEVAPGWMRAKLPGGRLRTPGRGDGLDQDRA